MVRSTLQNIVIGTLTYDKEYDWYETDYNDGGQIFKIRISVDGLTTNEEVDAVLKKAETLIKNKHYESAMLEMEEEMIKLKNGAWLEDEEPELTVDEFRKRINIESIVFYEDGSSEIYCDDDDIFWGHYILININENGTFDDVTIAG